MYNVEYTLYGMNKLDYNNVIVNMAFCNEEDS